MTADLEIASEIVVTEALQGDLSQTPLSAVLEQLATGQRSGVLRIDGGGELWLDAGRIYLAATASSPDIASVLFGAGISSLEAIEQLLSPPNSDVAGQLADSDSSGAAVLGRLLHEHNLTGLFELLVPVAGAYAFEDGPTHALGTRFAEPVGELRAQAERRLDIWRQIAARIPNTSISFKLSPALPEGGDERLVTADEWRYLSLLDGRRSVADVINSTGESAFRVCSSLYRLLLEGLVEEVSS
ncbi:MAG: hypothetical protein ACI8TP_001087 [Acidimicrobiales bacterium]|jgi:hypothetical protein